MHGKTLEHDLKGDLSGDMERLFVTLVQVGARRAAPPASGGGRQPRLPRSGWLAGAAAAQALGAAAASDLRPALAAAPDAPPPLQGTRIDRGNVVADVDMLYRAGEGKW
jgi:hypothetical protein